MVRAGGSRTEAPADYASARARLAHRHREAGVLTVEGPDRSAFLQGQLTQDVRGIGNGEARRAAGLTPKGKLLYFGWLIGGADRLLLVVPAACRAATLAHLSRYAVFQKVSVGDATPGFVVLGLYGPVAPGLRLPDGVYRLPVDGEMSAGALCTDAARAALEATLAQARSVELSADTAETLRIEAGRPRWGFDADDTNLPDEVGLEGAISIGKGCYVGQEVVARLRTYGRVSRRLVGLRFPDRMLNPGTAFLDPAKPGHELGCVTSSALSPRFGAIGLGFAARDVPEGASLAAASGAIAVVVRLPFS